MTFKQYRDSLRASKYNPLPQKEVNQMVIEGRDLDKVVNSHQRLIIKALSSVCNFEQNQDDLLFELTQVANCSLAESLYLYKEEKIDFSYYAFVSIKNAIRGYIKFNMNVVKSSIVEKERQDASYLYLNDDEVTFDVSYQPKDEVFSISPEILYDLIIEKHHLFKKKYMDVYAAYTGIDGQGGKRVKEVAEEFGIGHQRASQIIMDVKEKIKSNDKILAYLSEF